MSGTTQTPMPNRRPVASLGKATTPSVEEPDVQATASGESDIPAAALEEPDPPATGLGEPATALTREPTAPPTLTEIEEKVEAVPPHEFPSWMEIHPSCMVTPVGQVSQTLGDIRQCCQSCSSSRRRAQCHQTEEQRRSGQGNSSSTLLHESPMPDPSLVDPPKAPLPEF